MLRRTAAARSQALVSVDAGQRARCPPAICFNNVDVNKYPQKRGVSFQIIPSPTPPTNLTVHVESAKLELSWLLVLPFNLGRAGVCVNDRKSPAPRPDDPTSVRPQRVAAERSSGPQRAGAKSGVREFRRSSECLMRGAARGVGVWCQQSVTKRTRAAAPIAAWSDRTSWCAHAPAYLAEGGFESTRRRPERNEENLRTEASCFSRNKLLRLWDQTWLSLQLEC